MPLLRTAPCVIGDLAKQQALRLLKVGIGAFVWDFWTWFFNGNCEPYIQALPNWTNTWNAMPDLGFRCDISSTLVGTTAVQ